MQITMWKCDFNPLGMAAVRIRQKNYVLAIGNPIYRIIDPHPQLDIDRAVTKFP